MMQAFLFSKLAGDMDGGGSGIILRSVDYGARLKSQSILRRAKE